MTAPAHVNGSSRVVPGTAASSLWRKLSAHRTALWRTASIGLFFLIWEIAGRIPISFAFPTFLETLRAFLIMTFDGSFVAAYAETLQPLQVRWIVGL